MCVFHQYLSDAVRTTLWQASELWTARTTRRLREEADMTPSPAFPKSSKVSQSVLEWSKSIFQVFFTFPGLVLLVVLAAHSALTCHSVVRTASDRY